MILKLRYGNTVVGSTQKTWGKQGITSRTSIVFLICEITCFYIKTTLL